MLEQQIGAVIRVNRVYQNMSVRALAHDAGIEHSQLSKIERGLIVPNRRIYLSIFSALDLNFENITDYFKEIFDTVNELYYEIIYNPPTKDILEHLQLLNQRANKHGFTISILLINLIFSVLSKETMNISHLLAYLKPVEKSMNDYQKQLYYLYRGVYLTSIENLDAALLDLDKSIQYPAFDIGHGICHHQKGIIYLKKGNYFKSYDHLNKAVEHFNQHHVFVRSANVSMDLCHLYLLTHEYKKASQILKELLHCKNYIHSKAINLCILAEYLLLLCLILEKKKEFFELFNYLDKEFKTGYQPRSFQYVLYFIASYDYQDKENNPFFEQFTQMKYSKEEQNIIRYYTTKFICPLDTSMLHLLQKDIDHLKDYQMIKILLHWIIKKEQI